MQAKTICREALGNPADPLRKLRQLDIIRALRTAAGPSPVLKSLHVGRFGRSGRRTKWPDRLLAVAHETSLNAAISRRALQPSSAEARQAGNGRMLLQEAACDQSVARSRLISAWSTALPCTLDSLSSSARADALSPLCMYILLRERRNV